MLRCQCYTGRSYTGLEVSNCDAVNHSFIVSLKRRFKQGEQKVYDKERQLGDKVKEGVHKAGKTAEEDYDRWACHGP